MHTYQLIVDEIDLLMKSFVHTKKDIGYGRRRTFMNGMWFDLINYKKTGQAILRVGRGARLVRAYPQLHGYFDDVQKVITKVIIPDVAFLYDRHMVKIFELLDQAPSGIGAFD